MTTKTPFTRKTVPTISLISPTPVKPHPGSHRLLYKGALLLSDAHTEVPLQGVCFVAHLPPTSPTSFFSSPLALALESMHGRPSLRITSMTPFAPLQGRLDDSVDVRVYWHPWAYHANEFFLRAIWALGGSDEEGNSKQCVRLALGDGDPEENDIIIYGHRSPISNGVVRFHAARLLPPAPPQPVKRPPRPDDPLPRRIPYTLASPGRQGRKRAPSSPEGNNRASKDRLRKKGKIVLDPYAPLNHGRSKSSGILSFGQTLSSVNERTSFGKGLAVSSGMKRSRSFASLDGGRGDEDDVFKVPEYQPTNGKGLTNGISLNGRAKSKQESQTQLPEKSDLELANKAVIKKLTLPILAARGISRDHEEFKEMFGWVTRGVGFAARRSMNVQKLEREAVKLLILKHVEMYVDEPMATTIP